MIKSMVTLLLWPVIITGILLLSLGVISYEKPTYACFNSRSFRFDEKVEIAEFWGLKINSIPIRHDCSEDERYNPELIEKCGHQRFCAIE